MSKKLPYFKLSPELGDGLNDSIVDSDDFGISLILESVKEWCEEMRHEVNGESIQIELVMLTDEELKAMPEL